MNPMRAATLVVAALLFLVASGQAQTTTAEEQGWVKQRKALDLFTVDMTRAKLLTLKRQLLCMAENEDNQHLCGWKGEQRDLDVIVLALNFVLHGEEQFKRGGQTAFKDFILYHKEQVEESLADLRKGR